MTMTCPRCRTGWTISFASYCPEHPLRLHFISLVSFGLGDSHILCYGLGANMFRHRLHTGNIRFVHFVVGISSARGSGRNPAAMSLSSQFIGGEVRNPAEAVSAW